ncbi:MAG TPA: hypothetical protein VN688_32295 [Gemmataceae bacterium]|nr:hypothetical protein [Gemmataceae bacterium]
MSEPTFGDLRQVLLGLGFQENPSPSRVRFEHARTDTIVLLRPYAADDVVDPAALFAVRRLLDERGVVGREEFDTLLRTRSLAN